MLDNTTVSNGELDPVEKVSIIVTVDPSTHEQKFLAVLQALQNGNSELPDNLKQHSDSGIVLATELLSRAKSSGMHFVCLILRIDRHGVLLPHPYLPFAEDDIDSIIDVASKCMQAILKMNGVLAYQNVSFTDKRLVSFAVSSVCDTKMLELALRDAEMSAQRQ